MNMGFEFVQKLFEKHLLSPKGSIVLSKYNKYKEKYPRIFKKIEEIYETSDRYEIYYKAKNKIQEPPICLICEAPMEFGKNRKYNVHKKCSIKFNTLQKYGVENSMYLEEVRNKAKETNIKRYGVANPLNSKEIRKKAKQTINEKYGVDNPAKSKEVKEKIKQTNLERYGYESASKNEGVRKKISDSQKGKQKRYPNLEKMGYKNPLSVPEIYEKTRKSVFEKYGCHQKQIHIIHKENLTKEFCESNFVENGLFNMKSFMEYFNLAPTGADGYYKKLEILFPKMALRSAEREIASFIKSIYDGEILTNTRKIITPLELDIYIPEFNFAIEFNGLYWHSTDFVDKNYHKNKLEQCEEKGIHLFQIMENEWNDPIKREIWKSKISLKLHKNITKIDARKCSIKEVNAKTSRKFLKENHLQGYAPAKYKFGLFYKNELVSLATFSSSRFKKGEMELIRFASKKYMIVRGGFGKLSKRFKEIFGDFISYGNRRWTYFGNNVYSIFSDKVEITNPNLFYTDLKNMYNRMMFQKHKLEELCKRGIINNYDKKLTAIENMRINGYKAIYDAGNLKFYF